jgi:polar amino acid transport system substrate-binding protein
LARKDNPSIGSWDDLAKSRTRQSVVGVLSGSSAEKFVRARFGKHVDVRSYQGSTEAMLEVQNHKIDATVQDLPAAAFYINRFPTLHIVGARADRGYYVIYLSPADRDLRDALNNGIVDLVRTGKLRAIYEKYGIWNATQEKLGAPGGEVPSPEQGVMVPGRGTAASEAEQSTEVRGWDVLRRNFGVLLEAAWITVKITCLAMPLAIVVGLLVALGRLYGPAPLGWLLAGYVEVLRGTPVLLQLYTLYFVLPPALGFSLPPLVAAVLGLAINYSAYEAEIYRAGLLAIPVGQMEAALSLGMTRRMALWRIIVPQAVRMVIPPVTNDFIALFKDTSICSVITVVELTKRYSILVNNTNAYLELAVVTALLYLMMSYPLSLLARRLERKIGRVVA